MPSPRSLAEHQAHIRATIAGHERGTLDLSLGDAVGAVLSESLVSSVSVPEHTVAAFDGYAVHARDVSGAARAQLPVVFDAEFLSDANAVVPTLVPGTAARISSGMPVPRGADAVVPLAASDGGIAVVTLQAEGCMPGNGTRAPGSDLAVGQVVAHEGQVITPYVASLAAAIGQRRVQARPVPRVVVLAVGSELTANRGRGGVVDINSHLLAGLLTQMGVRVYRAGTVGDDRLQLRAAIEEQLVRADVLITTGGLSEEGSALAGALGDLGEFERVVLGVDPQGFHGVGSIDVGEGRSVVALALPGRPVAAALAFEAYVRPLIAQLGGSVIAAPVVRQARLSGGWASPPQLMQPVPVRLSAAGGAAGTAGAHGGAAGVNSAASGATLPLATPVGDPQQVTLADVAAADALVWVPAGVAQARAGDVVNCVSIGH